MSAPLRIAFVCSGNICRSPMAEHIFRSVANSRGIQSMTLSMGTLGIVGRKADSNAIAACREIGIDLESHRSQGLSLAVLSACRHVFVMEQAHVDFIARMAPKLRPKLQLMGEWDPNDGKAEIDDPIGRDLDEFRDCRDRIVRAVERYLTYAQMR